MCRCGGNTKRGVVKKHNNRDKIVKANCIDEVRNGKKCERCELNNKPFQKLITQ